MSNRKQRDKNRATARKLSKRLVCVDTLLYGVGAMQGGKRIRPADLFKTGDS